MLESVEVENFGPFRERATLSLGPGLNVIVGANNAGKSALLKALRGNQKGVAHRSILTKPSPEGWTPPPSIFRFKQSLTRDEFWILLEVAGANTYDLPIGRREQNGNAQTNLARQIIKDAFWTVSWIEANADGSTSPPEPWGQDVGIRHNKFVETGPIEGIFTAKVQSGAEPSLQRTSNGKINSRALIQHLVPFLRERIIWLDAQRPKVGICRTSENRDRLQPNGQNLPVLLADLQANQARFNRYTQIVQEVLPEIRQISVLSNAQDSHIEIWFHDPSTERNDLCFQVNECGSGTGQILLLVYAILENAIPQTIIVDEPQSFLHPGALRRLMSVLENHGSKHQIILTTHSAAILGASNPSSVFLVKRKKSEVASEVISIDPAKAAEARRIAAETGLRLSDVFGAETVLWVEGPTEELALEPLIGRCLQAEGQYLRVLKVNATGSLSESKSKTQRKAAINLHETIAQGGVLLPARVTFLLDRELRSEDEIRDLEKLASHSSIHFLDRRMLENYVLHPQAIAEMLALNHETNIPIDDVARVIEGKKAHGAGRPASERSDLEGWEAKTDAARVLQQIVDELTPEGHGFQKTRDTVFLVGWLIENDPLFIMPLVECVAKSIGGSVRDDWGQTAKSNPSA